MWKKAQFIHKTRGNSLWNSRVALTCPRRVSKAFHTRWRNARLFYDLELPVCYHLILPSILLLLFSLSFCWISPYFSSAFCYLILHLLCLLLCFVLFLLFPCFEVFLSSFSIFSSFSNPSSSSIIFILLLSYLPTGLWRRISLPYLARFYDFQTIYISRHIYTHCKWNSWQ